MLQERPSLLYFAAFAATLAGLVLYHAHGEPARGPLRPPPDSDPEALPGDDGGSSPGARGSLGSCSGHGLPLDLHLHLDTLAFLGPPRAPANP